MRAARRRKACTTGREIGATSADEALEERRVRGARDEEEERDAEAGDGDAEEQVDLGAAADDEEARGAAATKMVSADARKKVMVQNAVSSSAVATSTKRMPPWTRTATCETGAPTWPGVTPAQNISTNSEMIAVRSAELLGEDATEDQDAEAAADAFLKGAARAATMSQPGLSVANKAPRSRAGVDAVVEQPGERDQRDRDDELDAADERPTVHASRRLLSSAAGADTRPVPRCIVVREAIGTVFVSSHLFADRPYAT